MSESRVPLSSLPNGTILLSSVGTYSPAVGATAWIYTHGTTNEVAVYAAETGETLLSQPLTSGANGQLPGYVLAQKDLDVVATANGRTATGVVVALRANDLTNAVTSAIATAEAASDVAGTAAFDTAVERSRAETIESANASAITAEKTRAEAVEALKLSKAENLKDLANATTARTSLGLGSAATESVSAFDAKGAAAAAQAAAESASDAKGLAAAEKTRAEAVEALLIPLAEVGAPSGVMGLTTGSIGAQPPAHHASTHAEGGTDALTLGDLPGSVLSDSRGTAAGDILVYSGSTFAILKRGNAGERMIVCSDGTIRYEPEPRIPVEAWGATGDEITDDTEACHNLSKALKAKGGGIGVFSGKGYVIDGLEQENKVSWEGAGKTATRILAKPNSTKPGIVELAPGPVNGIRWKGMEFVPHPSNATREGLPPQDIFYLRAQSVAGKAGGLWGSTFEDLTLGLVGGAEGTACAGNCVWLRGGALGSNEVHQYNNFKNVEMAHENTGPHATTSRCIKETGQCEKTKMDSQCVIDGRSVLTPGVGTNIEMGREFLLGTALSAGALVGATTIEVESTAGLAEANKIFRLGEGSKAEILTAASVAGKVVTLKAGTSLQFGHAAGENVYPLSGTVAAPATRAPRTVTYDKCCIQNADLQMFIEGVWGLDVNGVDFENQNRIARVLPGAEGALQVNFKEIRVNGASEGKTESTGDLEVGSVTVAKASTGWKNGDAIHGPGIPLGTTVASGGGTATITLSSPVVANGVEGLAKEVPLVKGGNGEGYIASFEGTGGPVQGTISYQISGPVDRTVIRTGEASVRVHDLSRRTPVAVTQSVGVALSLAATAELKVLGAREVILTNAGTPIKTIVGYHASGELLPIRASVTGAKIEPGGNITLAAGTVTLKAGEIATLLRTDNGPTAWVLVGVQRASEPVSACDVLVIPGGKLFYQGRASIGTSKEEGNERLRLAPVFLPACTITELFLEFTVAGEAGSIAIPAIYADNGSFYPGALKVAGKSISTGSGNAGEVATGGTPNTYSTGALAKAVTLVAGLYWIGGLLGGAPTTQPTFRTALYSDSHPSGEGALPVPNKQAITWDQTGISALPEVFTASRTAGGATPIRVGLRAE